MSLTETLGHSFGVARRRRRVPLEEIERRVRTFPHRVPSSPPSFGIANADRLDEILRAIDEATVKDIEFRLSEPTAVSAELNEHIERLERLIVRRIQKSEVAMQSSGYIAGADLDFIGAQRAAEEARSPRQSARREALREQKRALLYVAGCTFGSALFVVLSAQLFALSLFLYMAPAILAALIVGAVAAANIDALLKAYRVLDDAKGADS
jgi:hypothetical protein